MSSPSSALAKCTEELTHPRITVRAHGRAVTFLNPGRAIIKRIDLDCWLCDAKTPKADYMVCSSGVVDVVVELKGKDIHRAIEQILATLASWKGIPSRSAKIGGLIVFTRSPERSAALDNIKAKLLAKYGIWLEMGKSGLKDYEFQTFTGARA
jgi:hypothetical protein